MKILAIIIIALLALVAIMQVFSMKSTRNIETYRYSVVKSYDGFEIRKYESRLFTYITMNSSSYKESSRMGFRSLAAYIFGGNEKNEKIAMTSPVSMQLNDSISMAFMVPAGYDEKSLPTPNNANVRFKKEPKKTVAAIRFGGWANDKKITTYKKKLKNLLDEQHIPHADTFSFLGYNPPFELFKRRNEIIVEVY